MQGLAERRAQSARRVDVETQGVGQVAVQLHMHAMLVMVFVIFVSHQRIRLLCQFVSMLMQVMTRGGVAVLVKVFMYEGVAIGVIFVWNMRSLTHPEHQGVIQDQQ